MEDISLRLDRLTEYQEWLRQAPKTLWGVPMAFGGAEFWTREPTKAEEVSMTMLSLNHGAKGIVMWDWPTLVNLTEVTSQLSRIIAGDEVAGFLLGAATVKLEVDGHSKIDAAGWRVGGQMLVSILSLQTPGWSEDVSVQLPDGAHAVSKVLMGEGKWKLDDGNLVKSGGHALETDLIVVEFAG